MITAILIPAIIAAGLFLVGETIRRRVRLSNEYSRKWIHVLHGLTVISWSFFLPDNFIIGFEIIFFFAMFGFRQVVKRWPQFGWMYDVKRRSYGEFFYPIGIIVTLLLTDSSLIFAAAIGQLAVADAVAALVGKRFGAGNEYKIFGSTKSVAGTAAFIVTAMVIFSALLLPTHALPVVSLAVTLFGLSTLLALVENASSYGSDNLFLPFVTAAVLQSILL